MGEPLPIGGTARKAPVNGSLVPAPPTGGRESRWLMEDSSIHRIECALLMMPRIIDPENYAESLMANMSDEELTTVFKRAGHLNIFSPEKPCGSYDLDLAVFDQRETFKLIMDLSLKMKSPCTITAMFLNGNGLELPPHWMDDLPSRGRLEFVVEESGRKVAANHAVMVQRLVEKMHISPLRNTVLEDEFSPPPT